MVGSKYTRFCLLASIVGATLAPSSAFCETNNVVELGEFIKLFMFSKSEYVGWDIGAKNTNLPIRWITEGVDTDTNLLGEELYFRDAIADVKVNGKVITILKTKVERAPWNIRLWSTWRKTPMEAHFGVDECPFASDCEYSVKQMLKASSIQYGEICSKTDGGAEDSILYLISHANKEGHLLERHTCGSGGCTTLLTLIYNPGDSKDIDEICSKK